ncbi:hypothetical protein TNCV_1791561 [Trichonephila clavipes]|nr:hypothetical protein TNCV_1791561 [Trichonephila clavipes]
MAATRPGIDSRSFLKRSTGMPCRKLPKTVHNSARHAADGKHSTMILQLFDGSPNPYDKLECDQMDAVVYSKESQYSLSIDNKLIRMERQPDHQLDQVFVFRRHTVLFIRKKTYVHKPRNSLKNVFEHMTWPSRSLDLFPIEYVKNVLGKGNYILPKKLVNLLPSCKD